MNGSGFFRLGWSDLARGLVIAVLGAVLTAAQQAYATSVDPTAWDWRTIGGIALGAALAYLAKNLLSTDDGKFAGKIGAVALALVLGLSLTACANGSGPPAPGQAADAQAAVVRSFITACDAYRLALDTAATAMPALPDAAVARIDAVRPVANALCQGPMPEGVADGAARVTLATATILAAVGTR
jgi:hypothetical protein